MLAALRIANLGPYLNDCLTASFEETSFEGGDRLIRICPSTLKYCGCLGWVVVGVGGGGGSGCVGAGTSSRECSHQLLILAGGGGGKGNKRAHAHVFGRARNIGPRIPLRNCILWKDSIVRVARW